MEGQGADGEPVKGFKERHAMLYLASEMNDLRGSVLGEAEG